MNKSVREKAIDLALQGGGSHGAFTWGVLDRLLEEEQIHIAGISGASAGAMNAVVLTSGLLDSGREGARQALRRFWMRLGDAARISPMQNGPLAAFFGSWGLDHSPFHVYWDLMSRMWSPYQFNPLNFNPLRAILNETVDFERLRASDKVNLFISATSVRTGHLRVFRRSELSADVVMASACLPLLFQAVEIDGEAYWDGGYTGNPALLPLIADSPASDLMIVQVNPLVYERVPTLASEIMARVNDISFNSSLLKEIRMVALMKKLIQDEGTPGHHYKERLFHQIDSLRLHHIHAHSFLARLGPSSKSNITQAFLTQLFEIGRGVADAWLTYNLKHLGRRSTVDLTEYQ